MQKVLKCLSIVPSNATIYQNEKVNIGIILFTKYKHIYYLPPDFIQIYHFPANILFFLKPDFTPKYHIAYNSLPPTPPFLLIFLKNREIHQITNLFSSLVSSIPKHSSVGVTIPHPSLIRTPHPPIPQTKEPFRPAKQQRK